MLPKINNFDMAIRDRTTKIPGKLYLVSNFIVSSYFVSTFKFFLMFILFVVDAWWRSYGGRVPNLQRLVIPLLSQTYSSSECERNWSVFEKTHTKKRNRLKNFQLIF